MLRQHAIERSAKGVRVMVLRKPTARPRWKECGSNAVTDLDASDAFANGDDLAGAVRHGHDPLEALLRGAQDCEVTVVQ